MERGRIVLAFGEPCAGVHGFWRRRETSFGPRRYKAAGVFVLVSPVRERRGRWRRRETEWPEEDLALPPWQEETSPPSPLTMNGEGEICFDIWRAVRGSARAAGAHGEIALISECFCKPKKNACSGRKPRKIRYFDFGLVIDPLGYCT